MPDNPSACQPALHLWQFGPYSLNLSHLTAFSLTAGDFEGPDEFHIVVGAETYIASCENNKERIKAVYGDFSAALLAFTHPEERDAMQSFLDRRLKDAHLSRNTHGYSGRLTFTTLSDRQANARERSADSGTCTRNSDGSFIEGMIVGAVFF